MNHPSQGNNALRPLVRAIPYAAVLIAMISVQIGASCSTYLFAQVDPEGATVLRQGFSTLVLMALFRPWRHLPPRADLIWVAVYGGILGAMNLLFYLSIARIPLGVAVALEFSGPLAVAVLSSRRWLDFGWIACALVGILILSPLGALGTTLDALGVALALAAGVLWALYILVGQKVSTRVPGGQAVALGMAVALLVNLPFGVFRAGARLFLPDVLLLGAVAAILSSAIPYTLEMLALKSIPAKTFGLMMSLEPAIAALAGLVLLQQELPWGQGVAIGLVILASAGSSLTGRKERPREPQ